MSNDHFIPTQQSFPAVLSDHTIKEYMERGLLIESQISPNQMQPNSVDLTLGHTLKILQPNDRYLPSCEVGTKFIEYINPKKEIKYYEDEIADDGGCFILKPNQFVLMASQEILNIPNGILSFVQGRSSIARIGIQTEQAGLIDAGFRGTITFEVYNQSGYPIGLYPGMRVAQVYFFHAQMADQLYGSDKRSKYSGQIAATGSRIHLDPELNPSGSDEISFCKDESERSRKACEEVKDIISQVYTVSEHDYYVRITGRSRKNGDTVIYDVYDRFNPSGDNEMKEKVTRVFV